MAPVESGEEPAKALLRNGPVVRVISTFLCLQDAVLWLALSFLTDRREISSLWQRPELVAVRTIKRPRVATWRASIKVSETTIHGGGHSSSSPEQMMEMMLVEQGTYFVQHWRLHCIWLTGGQVTGGMTRAVRWHADRYYFALGTPNCHE